MKRETWRQKVQKLWRADDIHGIELAFDICILSLRYGSVSYWSKDVWLIRYLDARGTADPKKRRLWRDNLIDVYCVSQLLVLIGLLFADRQPKLVLFISLYVLFEIYLNLASIFFLPRQKKLGLSQHSDGPSAVNEPSTRAERSILLLLINVLQVILVFAILYKISVPSFSPAGAFCAAVLAFGTLASPPGVCSALVAVQVALDFFLVAAILGNFVGQAGPFRDSDKS